MGLRCQHPNKSPIIKGTPCKRSKARKCKEKIDGLFDIAQHGYKESGLLTDLMDKIIPKKYKEQLCLVWFTHLVILAKDVNKVIEDNLLVCVEDFDKFQNYPWGYDSFYLLDQYLLTKLSSGTTILYGFPWSFMAWEFEAIPPLRKQVMDYLDEVSHPRMFRWLATKSNTKIKEVDLFIPPDDATRLFKIIHPVLIDATDG
ncbi:putative glycerol-3-phosphate 2-O-acyltransferase 6-like [Capsicum annuum]|nr:putative glycerol-3-phosphate 2-O-acyltransferase 6-like [Capsicum annuum]